jgi:hypothetical protein
LHREKLAAARRNVTLAVRQIIKGTKLTSDEKNEIIQERDQIPIIIDRARRDQTRVLSRVEEKRTKPEKSQKRSDRNRGPE